MRFLQIAKVKAHCTPNYLQNFTLAGCWVFSTPSHCPVTAELSCLDMKSQHITALQATWVAIQSKAVPECTTRKALSLILSFQQLAPE